MKLKKEEWKCGMCSEITHTNMVMCDAWYDDNVKCILEEQEEKWFCKRQKLPRKTLCTEDDITFAEDPT